MTDETSSLWSIGRVKAAIDVEDFDVIQEWLQNAKPSLAVLDKLLLYSADEEKDNLFSLFLDAGASPLK